MAPGSERQGRPSGATARSRPSTSTLGKLPNARGRQQPSGDRAARRRGERGSLAGFGLTLASARRRQEASSSPTSIPNGAGGRTRPAGRRRHPRGRRQGRSQRRPTSRRTSPTRKAGRHARPCCCGSIGRADAASSRCRSPRPDAIGATACRPPRPLDGGRSSPQSLPVQPSRTVRAASSRPRRSLFCSRPRELAKSAREPSGYRLEP